MFTVVANVTHSWFRATRGQDQESLRICFCVNADSRNKAEEAAEKIIKNWIEAEWPDLSEIRDEWASCFWHSIDSLDIGPESVPIVL